MSFSSGDYIAIVIGASAILRWVIDAFFKKADTDEEKLIVLRLDFEREKAKSEERDANVATSLIRIDRSLNNLQAQFRMLVTGSANKRLKITDLSEEEDN